jgi:hypothetical protein
MTQQELRAQLIAVQKALHEVEAARPTISPRPGVVLLRSGGVVAFGPCSSNNTKTQLPDNIPEFLKALLEPKSDPPSKKWRGYVLHGCSSLNFNDLTAGEGYVWDDDGTFPAEKGSVSEYECVEQLIDLESLLTRYVNT